MPRKGMTVGVVAVSRKPVSRWAKRGFVPSAVLPAVPSMPPRTRLGPEGDVETWYLGPASIEFHPGDTGHYRDNLLSGRPSVWVALRAGREPEVHLVTVDPYEGEAIAGDPGLVVEAVPMPEALRLAVTAFFEAHHVEEVFVKRNRTRSDPGGRRPEGSRVLHPDKGK